MAAGDEFTAYVLELLAPLGHARAKRMFGGHGIYVDELFIALVVFERLYLKVDDQTRAAFEAAQCEAFTYEGKKGDVHVMSYWTAPADALESSDEMRPWARRAIEAALRAKAAVKPKRANTKAAGSRPANTKAADTGAADTSAARTKAAPTKAAKAKPTPRPKR